MFKIHQRTFSIVGRRPVILEPGVMLTLTDIARDPRIKDYTHRTTAFVKSIQVQGPLGTQHFRLVDGLEIARIPAKEPENTAYSITLNKDRFSHCNKRQKKFIKSMWGLTSTLLNNMATGVKEGFYAIVRLVGVGYKAMLDENGEEGRRNLLLKVGFSHVVTVPIPESIAKVEILANNSKISIFGIDKQQVMLFAHSLRSIRKPNVYTGKGIYVDDETIVLKQVNKK